MRSLRLVALLLVLAVLAAVALRQRSGGPRCTPPISMPFAALVELAPMFGGKTFDKPVQLLPHPSEAGAWLVTMQRGVVERYASRDATEGTVVLDVRDRIELGQQWGLQAIALHPRFAADPRVFFTYVGKGAPPDGVVSRVGVVRTALEGAQPAPGPDVVLFSEEQTSGWHPIAGLSFGPDGYLYIGWGYGQLTDVDPSQLRSTLLRVDVDRAEGGKPYAVPADNPFLGGPFDPAVYAVGFRNPWRFSFDVTTGALWLGDVGQEGYEEIDRIVAGGDYGWPVWEGTTCRLSALCQARPSVAPVYQHTHAEACSVIGGYVYHGRSIPSLRGKYVYGDTCTGNIWALAIDDAPPTSVPVAHTGIHFASMAEDAEGELYVVASKGWNADGTPNNLLGRIYAVRAATTATLPAAPPVASLAALGCVVPDTWGASAPNGMVAYAINHPSWEDGADVERFMTTLPQQERWGMEDAFVPPTGSVVLKTYRQDGRPRETQMLARRADGLWDAYVFEWNAEGSDAFANPNAAAGCRRCHDPRVGTLRALTISQLNRAYQGVEQIAHFEKLGILHWPWKGGVLPAKPELDDETVTVETRARTYLDVNCASCHQPGGESSAARFDMRASTPLAATGLCGQRPNIPLDDAARAYLVMPGAPERSMISLRLHRTDAAAMPPGRRTVDSRGTRVVDAWIRSLIACPSDRAATPTS